MKITVQQYNMVCEIPNLDPTEFFWTALDPEGFEDIYAVDAQLDALAVNQDRMEYEDQEKADLLQEAREELFKKRKYIVPTSLMTKEMGHM